ncbi:energy transducer TonB [Spirosoma luteum]|uniref:energy transducer TonB n=1 Tax=Spirosoma luteum TaxID=431553 RepID=UPI00036828B4|nr:energy transducer TonB [Spirosoma luteum]
MKTKSLFQGTNLAGCVLLSLLLTSRVGLAQAPTELAREKTVFTVVEQQPEFVGGMKAYQSFMQNRVRQLKDTTSKPLTGKVFVSFIVTDQGAIEEVAALNRQGSPEATEAVNLVQQMPAWKPGRQAGRAVNVKYNLPINFSGR